MRVTTHSSIGISESLACFLFGSYVENVYGCSCLFEKRLNNVKTGKYSIADAYIPEQNTAIEVKSVAHGSSALKGVMQASMYKEQVDNGVFCMQRPRRKPLRDTIEGMSDALGVGVVYIDSVPSICEEDTITNATGGCSKPFEIWKKSRYSTTKDNIIARSKSDYIEEYIDTLEQIIDEEKDSIFNFVVEPDPHVGGLSDIY